MGPATANLTRTEKDVLTAKAQPAYSSWMLPVKNGTVSPTLHLRQNEFVLIEAGGDPAGTGSELDAERLQMNQDLTV